MASIDLQPASPVDWTIDPYPFLRAQRLEDPVWHGSMMDFSHRESMRPTDEWTLLDFESAHSAFRRGEVFSSAILNEIFGAIAGPTIVGMSGKEHLSNRGLVAKAFRSKALASWEDELIVPQCAELVTAFKNDGEADLVQALTFDFPTRIVARLLGLPQSDMQMFRTYALALTDIADYIEPGLAAAAALRPYFLDQVQQRRVSMTADVIGDLVGAEIDGDKLTDDAIVSFLILLLSAGLETTYRFTGNLLYLLLTHPDQLADLRADRTLIGQTIEEGLRFETPLITAVRRTTEEIQIGDKVIPAEAMVSICTGSANRDETRWEDGEKFDIHRVPRAHLSFAAGAHSCLGMHLARLEAKVILNTVLDHLDDIELVPDSGARIEGWIFRSPNKLPVTFRPTSHS